jgi:hypothetical protein
MPGRGEADTTREARMTGLDRRTGAACAESTGAVPDLARDVAHGVQRPAAPLTTYLLGVSFLGVAVGRGTDLHTAAAAVRGLAGSWPGPDES